MRERRRTTVRTSVTKEPPRPFFGHRDSCLSRLELETPPRRQIYRPKTDQTHHTQLSECIYEIHCGILQYHSTLDKAERESTSPCLCLLSWILEDARPDPETIGHRWSSRRFELCGDLPSPLTSALEPLQISSPTLFSQTGDPALRLSDLSVRERKGT